MFRKIKAMFSGICDARTRYYVRPVIDKGEKWYAIVRSFKSLKYECSHIEEYFRSREEAEVYADKAQAKADEVEQNYAEGIKTSSGRKVEGEKHNLSRDSRSNGGAVGVNLGSNSPYIGS